ncbi:4-oxalocrotonate decarboxylase [Solibacillus sp. R5-41]|uniref:2-keto-4-pentenoate hydratase n=1 Tax=Solibacillus sp. R5-41 TaxID=2048654 RepID=UPI000C12748D|nr:fumarylacetoacetate hydrolase family protein [Solibacillus sp. R5-41]ATP41187.1 4-oxalocrotonate decarboxylase [Solibacillus sp. R5-41]
MTLFNYASQVATAQATKQAIEKITVSKPDLTVEQAYEIQKISIEQTLTAANRFIGWKMGLTSVAKQQQVGVDSPIYGRLTSSMNLITNELTAAEYIHPRVEAEVAFVFKKALFGANLTPLDVWDAVESVYLALEVIDSRYQNFSFTLPDVIADNASSTKILLSAQAFSPYALDWSAVEVTLKLNGEDKLFGQGAAVLGHPIYSVIELLTMLEREGRGITPGQLVLTGGITDAIAVEAGDVIEADYGALGKLTLNVK